MSAHLTTPEEDAAAGTICHGEAIQFAGRFVAMTRREATSLIESHGGRVVDETPTLIVLGEESTVAQSEEATELARQTGAELLQEAEFVERLGLVGQKKGVSRLYTTTMLAGLVGVSVGAVRRWTRRGHLKPTEQLNRLAYFDFREATVAQRLGELLLSGKSLEVIDRLVDRLQRAFPEVDRPLAELPVTIEDGKLLVRDGEELTEPGGQRLLDFEVTDEEQSESSDGSAIDESNGSILTMPVEEEPILDPKLHARDLQDEGHLVEAIESWRLGMLKEPAMAEDHFTLAELLYESGDASAARERYYAALEIDPEYLEARVNLGCVLADSGDQELAIASFRGALEQYEPFADAHYHLAVSLDQIGDSATAELHWCRFLEIAPESPWADEAQERLS